MNEKKLRESVKTGKLKLGFWDFIPRYQAIIPFIIFTSIFFFILLTVYREEEIKDNINKRTDLVELQENLTNYALQIAEEYNYKLDFSDNSIKHVEKILSDIHNNFKKTKNEKGLNGIALEFGFYIIKVIEKNHGKGRLERDHEEFGENVFPYYWNGSTIFTYHWCLQRIYDGEGDNIVDKYEAIILNNANL